MSTDYFNKLDPPTQKWCKEKREVIGNTDLYSAPDSHFSVKIGNFPSICYPVNYLVSSLSPFSADDMRVYNSLEAYNQVIEDWVRDVKVMTTSSLKVFKGKVIRLTSLNLFVYVFPRYKIYLVITHFIWLQKASAYKKQGHATITHLIKKFRGYRHVKSCMPPTK